MTERESVINEIILKVKSMSAPRCDDHKLCMGIVCCTCGNRENPHLLPHLEVMLEELEKLKVINL